MVRIYKETYVDGEVNSELIFTNGLDLYTEYTVSDTYTIFITIGYNRQLEMTLNGGNYVYIADAEGVFSQTDLQNQLGFSSYDQLFWFFHPHVGDYGVNFRVERCRKVG